MSRFILSPIEANELSRHREHQRNGLTFPPGRCMWCDEFIHEKAARERNLNYKYERPVSAPMMNDKDDDQDRALDRLETEQADSEASARAWEAHVKRAMDAAEREQVEKAA